jgi:hypothetical protein
MITTFMRHAKNFISKDMYRPTCCAIMFSGEHAIATDTHQLVCIPFKSEKMIVDYKSGRIVEGEIPDIEKSLSVKNTEKIVLNRGEMLCWIKTLKIAKEVSKRWQFPYCKIENEKLMVSASDMNFSVDLVETYHTEKAKFSVLIPYMINILEFLAEVDESYFKEITIEAPSKGIGQIIIKAGPILATIVQVRTAENV